MGSDCRDVGAAPRHCTTDPAKRGGQARSAHGVGGGACPVLLSERSPSIGRPRLCGSCRGSCWHGSAKRWRSAVRVVADWLPLVGVLYLYDYSRGAADALGIPVHVVDPVDWDRALLFGNDATPWLQQRFSDPSAVHWWDTAASLIYVTHFLLVWIIAAVSHQCTAEGSEERCCSHGVASLPNSRARSQSTESTTCTGIPSASAAPRE